MKNIYLLFAFIMSAMLSFAEVKTGTCGKNITYTLDTETGVLNIEGTGDMYDYSSTWDGNSHITTAPWRWYASNLTSAVIEDGVTVIGKYAFKGCSGLTSVTIPNSVTSIGESAFEDCSGLTSVTIPNSVTSIGESAFLYCSGLTSVTIGNSVTSIGYKAFYECSGLTSVVIPNSVTSIGSDAFYECRIRKVCNLSKLYISRNDTGHGCVGYYAKVVFNGVVSTDEVDNLRFLTTDKGNVVLWDYVGSSVELSLPENYNGKNYSLGDYAFWGCSGLTSVTIPNSVTSIGNYAFQYCSGLTSVTIPNSVTSIGTYAFYECSGLTSVTIGNSVTSIGSCAFEKCDKLRKVCNLSELNISPNSSSDGYVGYYAKVVFNGVVSADEVDNWRFLTTDKGNVVLWDYVGSSVELSLPENYNGKNYSLGDKAFYGCSGLTSVTIPNSVTSIGGSAFYNCSGLTSVVIPNSVTSIGSNAFCDCSGLTSVTIGNSVTSIGYQAFMDCSGLTSVTIPNSVTSIGSNAFCDCM